MVRHRFWPRWGKWKVPERVRPRLLHPHTLDSLDPLGVTLSSECILRFHQWRTTLLLGPSHTMASSEYEPITAATDGTAYGYAQTYDPSAFRQTPFHAYGAHATQTFGIARGNGHGRNRGGRDNAFRNGIVNAGGNGNHGGFARYPQHAPPPHQLPNQAYMNAQYPISALQSSSGSQGDVAGVEDASVDLSVTGDGSFHDGQGYHAMSGMVLPGA